MESTYWVLAIAGSALFLVKLGFLLLGFGDHDLGDAPDLDADHGSDAAFSLLSIQTISTFAMGAGWMGLVASKTWGLGPIEASLAAVGFGLFLVLLLGKLMSAARNLESSGNLNVQGAVGKAGRVYLRIPEAGPGQVQLELQGRLVTLDARSRHGELPTGTAVTIIEVDPAGTLIVARAS